MALLTIWILLSAWLCAAGWVLSVLHALNGTGYLLALAATAVVALLFRKNWWPSGGFQKPNWRKLWHRYQRPAPLMILAIAILGLASGLYAIPENGDSNAYRIPRVLHWLNESGWHWIRTEDSRQNISGCGYEWLFAPLILLTHTDRWAFLPNILAYFLLPTALFGFFRRLKVAAHAAWWWAWLTAAGWCYTFQACSTDNDALATVYLLAAIDFAMRAREKKNAGYLWFSLLAAGVLTAIKPTNLLLLLPCFVAISPSWRLLLARPLTLVAVAVFAALASFVPMAILNWLHTGSWKGFVPAAGPVIWWHWGSAQELPSPFWGIIGNIFCLTAQNLLPPFFPWAGIWNQAMGHFLQTAFGSHFAAFENFGHLSRSVSPTSAGLGLGVVTVASVSMLFIWKSRGAGQLLPRPAVYTWLVWTPWLALLVFMAKVGNYQNARYLAAYYPLLLLGLLLNPGMAALVRRRWWQRLVLLIMGGTLTLMVYIYGRAFIPASVFARLQASHRLQVLNAYYEARVSVAAYREFGARHAASESVVGFATICGGLEPGMWQPWGHGRVERILPDDSPVWVRSRGIHCVFIEDAALEENHETIEQWLARFNAVLVDQMTFATGPNVPRTHFYFTRLLPPGEAPAPAAPQPH
jgi:hypothetical protein